MNDYLLGIDIGTGGCKVTFIDTDGNYLADGYSEYKTLHPHVGWAEQDPNDWLPALINSLQKAISNGSIDLSRVCCVCLDASAHNMVLLDSDDRILRPAIMWTDQRSYKESNYLRENFGELIFTIGYQIPNPTWSLPQLLWIRNNEPTVFLKINRIMFIKDYVRYLLTGTWTTDYIEAQGSLLFDNLKWKWSEELCALCGISIGALPPLVKPIDIVGHISAEGARLTGLCEGVPVINGASDTSLESYCVGAINENSCVVKIATAGTVNYFRSKACPDPKALTYGHVVEGLWYTCLSTSSAAESLRWFRDVFYENDPSPDIYKSLDEKAEMIDCGSEGLIFHPHLMGERSPYWDPKLRASFVGITSHHRIGHFARSILEGVCFSINDNLLNLPEHENIQEVRIVGGGAKSPLWRSIIASVLNLPVIKYEYDDSSLGSAILAGVGIGAFSSHEDAMSKCLKLKERILPSEIAVEQYRKSFALYKEIHNDLVDTYHKMTLD